MEYLEDFYNQNFNNQKNFDQLSSDEKIKVSKLFSYSHYRLARSILKLRDEISKLKIWKLLNKLLNKF